MRRLPLIIARQSAWLGLPAAAAFAYSEWQPALWLIPLSAALGLLGRAKGWVAVVAGTGSVGWGVGFVLEALAIGAGDFGLSMTIAMLLAPPLLGLATGWHTHGRPIGAIAAGISLAGTWTVWSLAAADWMYDSAAALNLLSVISFVVVLAGLVCFQSRDQITSKPVDAV